MKITVRFLIISYFVLNSVNISAENITDTDPQLHKMAWEMRSAVLNIDINYLIKYVAPSGTYFIDNVYSYDDINKMFRDKNSWLYKHLFVGDTSVKDYFIRAQNLRIKIYKRDTNAILVSYQSSNFEALKWVENCFVMISERWYFDGIFTCQ